MYIRVSVRSTILNIKIQIDYYQRKKFFGYIILVKYEMYASLFIVQDLYR